MSIFSSGIPVDGHLDPRHSIPRVERPLAGLNTTLKDQRNALISVPFVREPSKLVDTNSAQCFSDEIFKKFDHVGKDYGPA